MNFWFYFTEQIDKLDVGGEKKLSRWSTAQMEFGMKKMELRGWAKIKHLYTCTNINASFRGPSSYTTYIQMQHSLPLLYPFPLPPPPSDFLLNVDFKSV